MLRSIIILSISGLIIGCAQAEPPATLPKPVTMNVPTEISPATPGHKPSDVAGMEGRWQHTLPGDNGAERRIILKYVKDQDGPERFEIVQHGWPDKPVFTEQTTNGKETVLQFKLVSKDNQSEETGRTLRYVLHEDHGKWVGTLHESWNNTPQNVVLTKEE